MSDIAICLWFDGNAEEAAGFYAGIFPDSRIDRVTKSTIDYPGGRIGDALTVEFTVLGRPYIGLNGGSGHPFTQAISLSVDCADQAEVDRYWDALIADGGSPLQCSWLTDRFGLSWQIVPAVLPGLLAQPDRAAAERVMWAMVSMVKMDIAALERASAGK